MKDISILVLVTLQDEDENTVYRFRHKSLARFVRLLVEIVENSTVDRLDNLVSSVSSLRLVSSLTRV